MNTTLGSYIVDPVDVIGTGSQGKIFRARNIYSNESVALKVFPASKSALLAFEIETHYLANLVDSPGNIITLQASFISEGYGCIAMPLCDADLLDRILANKITSKKAKKYFTQICKALEYSHTNGVAHLDIKPENVLINDSADQCVLCDFGHACSTYNPISGRGTKLYSSPETKTGQPYDPVTADIWSLGILLYVLISGCFPRSSIQEDNDFSVNLNVAKTKFSPSCFDLVSCILCEDPTKRPSITEILKHPWCKTEKSSRVSVLSSAVRSGLKHLPI